MGVKLFSFDAKKPKISVLTSLELINCFPFKLSLQWFEKMVDGMPRDQGGWGKTLKFESNFKWGRMEFSMATD